MNGIIPEQKSRSRSTIPSLATVMLLGGSLCSGFVFGMNTKPVVKNPFRFFKTETINFQNISWIADEKSKVIHLSQNETNDEITNLSFTPYQLESKKVAKISAKHYSHHESALNQLAKIFKELNTPRISIDEDYRIASFQLRGEFRLAVIDNRTELKVAQSISPTSKQVRDLNSVGLHKPIQKSSKQKVSKTKPKLIVNKLAKIVTKITTSRSSEELVNPEMNTQVVSIQNLKQIEAIEAQAEKIKVTPELGSITVSKSSELSPSDKKHLQESLLNAQVANRRVASEIPTLKIKHPISEKRVEIIDDQSSVSSKNSEPLNTKGIPASASKCNLDTHLFVRPALANEDPSTTQINPEQYTWISKSTSCSGWVKVESTNYIPTLTVHPAANGGSTLVLDQNSLALIAMRTGVHVAKGMGTILGVVPEGYEVEYTGRSEETEYFDANARKYFAILNAEPGAGVVQLHPTKNQNGGSTVFTPVLENTVTYLDLSKPIKTNLNIQVVKSGQVNDPDTIGLSVGLSTLNSIQAITQSNGIAALKNVELVSGFPVFVDVASKNDSIQGYTYRYQLKQTQANGTFLVNQVAEKSVKRWISQLKQGLSDQSAMIVGFYNAKKLNGHINHHYAKVEALTAKFGLEPMSYSILWDGQISKDEPLEGDTPRFMSIQVPEGLSQVNLVDEKNQIVESELLPISPRVIHVVSE